MNSKRDKSHFQGCLLGGAIGDSLGWPVEFKSYAEITRIYGVEGIKDLDTGCGKFAEVTDDTQMTVFTAEGLLRAETMRNLVGSCNIPNVVYNSYIRWLHTQGGICKGREDVISNLDGWVSGIKSLYSNRAPGNSCLSALRSGQMGRIAEPVNNSKGCGGVMRVAPVGLVASKEQAFSLGCEIAAITHGHPSGYLSAGVLSYIIYGLIEGIELRDSILLAIDEMEKWEGHEECAKLLQLAVELADKGRPSLKAIRQLGAGWTGEEAIAIAVYSSLSYPQDFSKALCLSVNHDGDSDSTGAITGNIMGAYLGVERIPQKWIEKVELKKELIILAEDLLKGFEAGEQWINKYPAW